MVNKGLHGKCTVCIFAAMPKVVQTHKCPICKGTGVTDLPYKLRSKERINDIVMAKMLHKDGYSLRQIGKYLGYKSPRSIQLLLK